MVVLKMYQSLMKLNSIQILCIFAPFIIFLMNAAILRWLNFDYRIQFVPIAQRIFAIIFAVVYLITSFLAFYGAIMRKQYFLIGHIICALVYIIFSIIGHLFSKDLTNVSYTEEKFVIVNFACFMVVVVMYFDIAKENNNQVMENQQEDEPILAEGSSSNIKNYEALP